MQPTALGWRSVLLQQIDPDELDRGYPARVMAVHRDRVLLASEGGETDWARQRLPDAPLTVGDWVWIEGDRATRRLQPFSLVQRKAAGIRAAVQRIAANLDTLFIVSSCNADFNPSRLERYLALAFESGVYPVIVLTKADLAEDPESYRARAAGLHPQLAVELINALDPARLDGLRAWCGPGQTVALVGSSGVGKTTLVNALAGSDAATAPIREDDAKGRHTTTHRELFALPEGGWLVDTPGMRELQLHAAEHGIAQLFDDIEDLAAGCRFQDCRHQSEPGCAVLAAIARGEVEPRRLDNYRKLEAEVRRNRETLAERRDRDRNLGRFYRSVLLQTRQRKQRD